MEPKFPFDTTELVPFPQYYGPLTEHPHEPDGLRVGVPVQQAIP